MWERRIYDDAACSVKYIGTVAPWGNQLAIGVEWDDPSRGKNSGEIDGVKYFDCKVDGAGSFIKASRKYKPSTDFGECFYNKYLTNPQFEEIHLSKSKQVETYDVDSIFEYQSAIENLIAIGLDGCRVSSMNSTINFHSFVNLTKLDLSYNLLASFGEIVNSSAEFPQLKTIRLDGNRFDFSDSQATSCQPNPAIKELSVNNCLLSENDINYILRSLPKLMSLSLAYNNLERIPTSIYYSSLHVLDVSHNNISSLKGLPPPLTHLYVSNCTIRSFDLERKDHLPDFIDLINNGPFDWANISVLGSRDVNHLKLNLATSKEAETNRPFIITRLPLLQNLDGTYISETERTDSELFTRSCVAKGTHPPLPEQLWISLNEKYGVLGTPRANSIRARLMNIYIGTSQDPIQLVSDAPIYRLAWCIARRENISKWNLVSLKPQENRDSSDCIDLTQNKRVGDILEDSKRYSIVLM